MFEDILRKEWLVHYTTAFFRPVALDIDKWKGCPIFGCIFSSEIFILLPQAALRLTVVSAVREP